jgi:hypothetical protein
MAIMIFLLYLSISVGIQSGGDEQTLHVPVEKKEERGATSLLFSVDRIGAVEQ